MILLKGSCDAAAYTAKGKRDFCCRVWDFRFMAPDKSLAFGVQIFGSAALGYSFLENSPSGAKIEWFWILFPLSH